MVVLQPEGRKIEPLPVAAHAPAMATPSTFPTAVDTGATTKTGYQQAAEPVPITREVATEVLPYAVLSRDVDGVGTSEALFGFKQVGESWEQIMLANGIDGGDVKRFRDAGFDGRVYRHEQTGEVVIAYPPSAPLANPFSENWSKDWGTNVSEGMSATLPQYEAAMKLAEATRTKFGNVQLTLTGFSKGGGQASYAGSVADKVVTFNGARNPDSFGGYNRNQTNVIVPGDWVGDPSGPFGIGSLPGRTFTVESSEPWLVRDLKLGTEKHDIDGILGGLLDAAGGTYRTSTP
jgi:hypothetical protein